MQGINDESKNLISVIIPIYNEAPSLKELYQGLVKVLNDIRAPFEVIFVNDGSTDKSEKILERLGPARIFHLKRNYGQTIALEVGIQAAKGDIIITMDGDLENMPEDIPLLIKKLNEGYDVVSGWRKDRWKKSLISRRLPSFLANRLLSYVSGLKLHDFGCMLKVYKREAFENISFSGDMHRLILAYMAKQGLAIAEIPVQFSPRRYGQSKYGIKRTFDVLIDIFAFYFFEKFHNKSLHFFGVAGFISFILSILAFIGMLIFKYLKGITFVQTPLPFLTVSFTIVGFQFILMGLIAELIYRFSRQQRPPSTQDYIKEEIISKT